MIFNQHGKRQNEKGLKRTDQLSETTKQINCATTIHTAARDDRSHHRGD